MEFPQTENISTIIVLVSLLNALIITNQISKLNTSGVQASALDVKRLSHVEHEDNDGKYDCNFQLYDKEKLETGHYNIKFAHRESLVSCADGRKPMHSKPYQENVCAIVVDEAHCILEW